MHFCLFVYLFIHLISGAFLVPYFSVMIFGAMPVFFMELCMGQFHRQGPITVWKMAPMFKGTVTPNSCTKEDHVFTLFTSDCPRRVCLSVRPSIHSSIHPSPSLSLCLCVHLSIYLSICFSVCLYFMSMYVCIYVCMSVHVYIRACMSVQA